MICEYVPDVTIILESWLKEIYLGSFMNSNSTA